MIKTFILALAIGALAIGAHTTNAFRSNTKSILVASGGSNCPVYYGCPLPPAPAPKGGGGNGGGGVDNSQPHA